MLAISTLALALAGAAQDGATEDTATEHGWDDAMLVVTEGVGGDPIEWIDVVFPTDTTKTGVMLMCMDGAITARFATHPVGFRDRMEGTARPPTTTRVRFFVNGEQVDKSVWAHWRKDRMLQPTRNLLARKTFNAVIRGDAITLRYGTRTVETYLPPPDEAFRAFASECTGDGLE